MANLISTADFKDELEYADNSDELKTHKLCRIIATREPEFLLNSLGYAVKTLFLAGIDSEEQRWLDLRDGVAYTVNEEQRWFGGILPLIRKYAYYWYMRSELTTPTMTGEKTQDAANSTGQSLHKAQQFFNEMARDIKGMWLMLLDRLEEDGSRTYEEFTTNSITQDQEDYFAPLSII